MKCIPNINPVFTPCLNSNPCDRNYNSDCVLIPGVLSCLEGTDISLTNALNQICGLISSEPSDECCLYTLKVHVTSAQILTIFTTPIQLLPTPGIGKIVVPLQIIANYTFNTTAYSSATLQANYMGNTDYVFAIGGILGGTSDLTIASVISSSLGIGEAPVTINAALLISSQTSNPTGGDGTIDFYITYKIITL